MWNLVRMVLQSEVFIVVLFTYVPLMPIIHVFYGGAMIMVKLALNRVNLQC